MLEENTTVSAECNEAPLMCCDNGSRVKQVHQPVECSIHEQQKEKKKRSRFSWTLDNYLRRNPLSLNVLFLCNSFGIFRYRVGIFCVLLLWCVCVYVCVRVCLYHIHKLVRFVLVFSIHTSSLFIPACRFYSYSFRDNSVDFLRLFHKPPIIFPLLTLFFVRNFVVFK